MILTLFDRKKAFTLVLPEKVTGRYIVNSEDEYENQVDLIAVEAYENRWYIKSNKEAFVKDSSGKIDNKTLIEPFKTYKIHKLDGKSALLYVEPYSEDRNEFTLHHVQTDTIKIGRSEDNEICFKNKLVSANHCAIQYQKDSTAIIKDLDSANGTYVNGIKIEEHKLQVGDVISIMGLRIIYNNRLLSLNNPHQLVFLNRHVFKPFSVIIPNEVEEEEIEEIGNKEHHDELFYRSPRFKREIERKTIKIDPPPQSRDIEETPLMYLLGPSLTMGMASLFIGIFAIYNALSNDGNMITAMPTLMMSLSMLTGTVLWPILTKRHEKKMRMKHEKLRMEKYLRYLSEMKKIIEDECEYQREILYENHMSLHSILKRVNEKSRNLWERVIDQNDFLKVRVGIGDLPLDAEIKYPEKKFTLEDDQLQDALYELASAPPILKQVPITVSLVEEQISGIIGNRDEVIDFTKGLIFQLSTLHSYDELKFVFIYDQEEQESWGFAKWLPHVWDEGKTMRYIATDANEVKELSSYFEKEIAQRSEISSHDKDQMTPHYVVFSMSKKLANKAEMINMLLKEKEDLRFSLITLYDELEKLPKECTNVIELGQDVCKIYDKDDISGKYQAFNADIYMRQDAEEMAIQLANIQLASSSDAYALPDMLTFLEMFGVGKVEHLNSLSRWKENNPTLTLETPIGVTTSGETFSLDLHEKYHGPHGLIAGMTGSGKSEFIMTFILSLAVNYHPDEVAFILIDYKGGGMANAFLDLPHLAGTITNLDGAAVNRSLISIQSELKRRQAIFSEASRRLNQSNIDIYKYQKLYREGVVKEPLQHLFMISDEFAELKTQQPEFMEQLVSAARIGRSLGVHLILATQKPSGVVDDQIWSNSKFRISLKVQEKADSMEVIKRPDAAELSQTGRFYLQVGYNELFELGQSAWAGAPYYPSEKQETKQENGIKVIDSLGRVMKNLVIDKNKDKLANPSKQIDEITEYLQNLAKQEKISVRQLWLEPIPALIYIDELKNKYKDMKTNRFTLNPVIGEYDDPAQQRQLPLRLPITTEGNVVIYGVAGSGKTTFLSTLLYSMMEEHSPLEVHFYLLDFGSETLTWYKDSPHVGDVVLSHESEKIENLFKMLHKEVSLRKKRFANFGGDYRSYIKYSNETMPQLVVAIHNYAAFTEMYDKYEEAISFLTREGTKYGIYFILTALNTGAVRYKLLQNFKQLFVLQLNDTTEYSSVLGSVNGVYPSKFMGRGIFKTNEVYEFQTAHISREASDLYTFTTRFCQEWKEKWQGQPARRIPILPEVVDMDYFMQETQIFETSHLPIGVDKNTLELATFDFKSSFVHLVTGKSREESTPFIQGLAEVLASRKSGEVMVIDSSQSFKVDGITPYQHITQGFEESIVYLFNTLVHRNNTTKDCLQNGEQPPVFEELICIIDSFTELQTHLSTDGKDKLKVFLEKGDSLNVIIILADEVDKLSSITYESWFKQQVSLSDAIWIGNGIADQYVLKVNRVTNEMYQELPADFGYVIVKGKVRLVKFLTASTSSEGVMQFA